MSAPYIHRQPVFETFFSCTKSCSLPSNQKISVRRTRFVVLVRNTMSGKKLKEESNEAEYQLAATDLRLEARQRRPESSIVCTESCSAFVLSSSNSLLRHVSSYSHQADVNTTCDSQPYWSGYYSGALFCFPNKTKILVDLSCPAVILTRK